MQQTMSSITIHSPSSETGTIDVIYLRDKIHEALAMSQGIAGYLDVQYQIQSGEICKWHMDIVNDQDIADALLFMNGFNNFPFDAELQVVQFTHYGTVPFEGGNNWRESVGSRETKEES